MLAFVMLLAGLAVSGTMLSLKPTKLIRPPTGTDPAHRREGNPKYLYTVTAFVSLGAFLFGYDQGVMGVIVADQRWIDLMHPRNSCESDCDLVAATVYSKAPETDWLN